MASQTFQLTVLSAERELFAGEVESVNLPTDSGEITVLARHNPLVTNLKAGELTIRKEKNEQEWLFIGGGILEFTPTNECRILADVAERVEEIDLQAAEQARQRAEEGLEKAQSEPEVLSAKAELFQTLAKIRVAEKNRKLRGRH